MSGNWSLLLKTGECGGQDITHYFLRQHPISSPAAAAKMAPPRTVSSGQAHTKKALLSQAPAAGGH